MQSRSQRKMLEELKSIDHKHLFEKALQAFNIKDDINPPIIGIGDKTGLEVIADRTENTEEIPYLLYNMKITLSPERYYKANAEIKKAGYDVPILQSDILHEMGELLTTIKHPYIRFVLWEAAYRNHGVGGITIHRDKTVAEPRDFHSKIVFNLPKDMYETVEKDTILRGYVESVAHAIPQGCSKVVLEDLGYNGEDIFEYSLEKHFSRPSCNTCFPKAKKAVCESIARKIMSSDIGSFETICNTVYNEFVRTTEAPEREVEFYNGNLFYNG